MPEVKGEGLDEHVVEEVLLEDMVSARLFYWSHAHII